MPQTIGLITSPSGAVLRDILHRLKERFPRPVLLWPVSVQGNRCARDVVAAIHGFNAFTAAGGMRPDVLILARGGGSLEDLWGFNEESVARAIAASHIPLVSAIGHETDTTLSDFAADYRAPTPTAAAEKIVPVRSELVDKVCGLDVRRQQALERLQKGHGQRLQDIARGLPQAHMLLLEATQKLDGLTERLPLGLVGGLTHRRLRFNGLAARIHSGIPETHILQHRARLRDTQERLELARIRVWEKASERLEGVLCRLPAARARICTPAAQKLPQISERLAPALRSWLDKQHENVTRNTRLLETLSYRSVLDRGYAVVRGEQGNLLARASEISPDSALTLELIDGLVHVRVDEQGNKHGSRKPSPRLAQPKRPSSNQGTLF